ncbi:PIN domain-containing protein [Aeromicrobium sp. CF4.19]|uniref:PIN domain-containing protein n=1 Tax=Aeromicrobium sp. CF4.19 TaxID=3373082 RepID=UPI003EE4D074
MFVAVLDTCVLWPSLQRDFLMSMAVEGLYRPLWSEAILEEPHRHEQVKLIDRGGDAADALAGADRLLANLREHFDDALVVGWEPLEGTYGLPDADDEHVVAAAVVGGAGAIVSDNLRHFPSNQVPPDIQILSGRDFAVNTADVDPERAARAIGEMAARRRGQTPHEIVELLVARYGMDEVAEVVTPILDRGDDPLL